MYFDFDEIPFAIITGTAVTKVKSNKLAPITLPKDNWGIFFIAEVMPINNSGNEVADPIRIVPITNSEILNFFARFDAEIIIILMLLSRINAAIMKINKSINKISP